MTGTKIAKNAAWLMVATTGQKAIAFVAFILVARWIGKVDTGVYFYSVSITSICVILADLGMTPVVIRAIAGAREDGMHVLGAALRTKLFLIPLAIIVALIAAVTLHADRTTLYTVAIACLVMSADSLNLLFYGVLRGRQTLRPEAIGMFVGQALSSTTAVIAAWMGWGPIGLACALLVGSAWNVIWSVRQISPITFSQLRPTSQALHAVWREAIPFAIAGGAVKVYSYVDSVILNAVHGSAAVGLYAVSYKLTYAFQFLPLTFTAALYPALASSFARGAHSELKQTFIGTVRLAAAVGFPLAAGLSALAPRLIPFLYGKSFEGAIPSLEILPWVLLPIFMDFPVGSLLNATHRAEKKTMAMVATMIVNIILNVIFVPLKGPAGAAIAGVVSFWLLFAIGVGFTRSDAGGIWVLGWLSLRGLIAALVSWIAWRFIGAFFSLPAAIVFGGAIAIAMAFIVRLITVDDVYRLITKFRPAPQKVEIIHE